MEHLLASNVLLDRLQGAKVYRLSEQIGALTDLEQESVDKMAQMLVTMKAVEAPDGSGSGDTAQLATTIELLQSTVDRGHRICAGLSLANERLMRLLGHGVAINDMVLQKEQRDANKFGGHQLRSRKPKRYCEDSSPEPNK